MDINQLNKWYNENLSEFDVDQVDMINHLVENYKTNYIGPEVDAKLEYADNFFQENTECFAKKIPIDKFISASLAKTEQAPDIFHPVFYVSNDHICPDKSFIEFGISSPAVTVAIGRIYQDGSFEFTDQSKYSNGTHAPISISNNNTILIRDSSRSGNNLNQKTLRLDKPSWFVGIGNME